MFPVIVCIAKKESAYIEEFVRYHFALGFSHIFLYDNEDVPLYHSLLEKYLDRMTIIHLPHNNYDKGVQYIALDHFIKTYLFTTNSTHIAHIDIDEFIVLKRHNTIAEFINEYITGNCQGIGMNWRFFGSSGQTDASAEPVTVRFTKCEARGNKHIKTLFKKDNFKGYGTCHDVSLSSGFIKATNGVIINGPFNNHIDFSVIQLNHYKCKTLVEFREIRKRGRADLMYKVVENVDKSFVEYDKNEVEELTACNFYKNIVDGQ